MSLRGIPNLSFSPDRLRDNSLAGLAFFPVDLSIARSGSSALQLTNITGNVLYVDPGLPGSPQENAYATLFVNGSPLTVTGGFLLLTPFDDIKLENPAQPGKALRIVYGSDIGLTPGAFLNVLQTKSVENIDYTRSSVYYFSDSSIANATIIASASNIGGVVIHRLHAVSTDYNGSFVTVGDFSDPGLSVVAFGFPKLHVVRTGTIGGQAIGTVRHELTPFRYDPALADGFLNRRIQTEENCFIPSGLAISRASIATDPDWFSAQMFYTLR